MEKSFNVKDLRDSLIDSYQKLQSGKLSVKKAKGISDLSSKIIRTAAIELDYNKYLKIEKKIEFLEVKP